MRILLTGGAGFIGSHTAKALIDEGARVVVVDNLSTGREENVDPRAIFYRINIAEEPFEEIVEKESPDAIFHFASYVLVPKSVDDPLLDIDSIVGSLRLLRKAKGPRTKVIFASSGFLYGNTTRLPAKETDPIQPVSPYVVAKRTVEDYLGFFNSAYGVPYVILRYAAVYGPGQVTGAMADYIRNLSSGKPADIWGDGNKTRDYIYIDDVVRANLLALSYAGDHRYPVFNIGTGIETTLNDLYWRIARQLDVEVEPTYHPDRPGEQIRYCLDYSKAKSELGWEPVFSLHDGLRITVEAGRERSRSVIKSAGEPITYD